MRAFKQRRNQIIDLHTKIRREKEVRDKHRKQAAKEAEEEEKRRKKTERQTELERRRQELERTLPPKRRRTRAVKVRLKELEEEAHRLLPAITEWIHQTANNTPKHSYNHIIMDETAQTALEEQRKHTQSGVQHIYSNGSMVNIGQARCAMAFAVVGEHQPVIQGTTKGFASSVKAELMGLIAGIIATPQDQYVCIRLDNQAVVKLFNGIVINRRRASVRAKLRCDYAVEWAIVARICSERTGSTTVEWVKGHRGDRWNAAADKAAKEAQSVVGKAWEVNAEEQDGLRYTATMAGTTLEIDTRQALKMQTTRRWHQAWGSLKRHKRLI